MMFETLTAVLRDGGVVSPVYIHPLVGAICCIPCNDLTKAFQRTPRITAADIIQAHVVVHVWAYASVAGPEGIAVHYPTLLGRKAFHVGVETAWGERERRFCLLAIRVHGKFVGECNDAGFDVTSWRHEIVVLVVVVGTT